MEFIAQYFDVGIIIGILLMSEFIKNRLHQATDWDNSKLDYKIMPFVPLMFGLFAGVTTVLRDAEMANNIWNIIWAAIKYAGASTFLYKFWSRFGRDAIEKFLKRKIQ